ncbi:CTD nuclear envelope phosphatase 1A-like [Oncorhynchus masou masou]|uniref:CTD nuclear envelope phosphatase 1A-like n=1 Tax=Oncorhynchus masou masou TaxID=90313 RepID=UPI003182BD9E
MLKTRHRLLGIHTFVGVTSRIWGFILYILRKHLRTIIQYQTVRYDTLPLLPVSRNRLNAVKRKILVLDLDETLIHSHPDRLVRPKGRPKVRPGTPPDFILKVVINRHPVRFLVHKRPHVDFFLEVVSQWYELVVFTASMEIYGSAVSDKLDRDILKRRYYRQHCTLDLGSYVKDLSVVHNDLSSIVILDNSPGAYRIHPGSPQMSDPSSVENSIRIGYGDLSIRASISTSTSSLFRMPFLLICTTPSSALPTSLNLHGVTLFKKREEKNWGPQIQRGRGGGGGR